MLFEVTKICYPERAADKVVHLGGIVSELNKGVQNKQLIYSTFKSGLNKAVQAKLLINTYETSGYLQMLNNEAPPLECRKELLRKEWDEGLYKPCTKKCKFH